MISPILTSSWMSCQLQYVHLALKSTPMDLGVYSNVLLIPMSTDIETTVLVVEAVLLN